MNLKQIINNFLISPIFPSVSILLIKGAIIVFNLINPQAPILPICEVIILILLACWIIIRWSLEHNLALIKEYKHLMISLKEHNTNQAIEKLFTTWNFTVPSQLAAKELFDSKRMEIDINSNELNVKLDKIISNPYCLLYINVNSIETEFINIYINVKTLSDNFVSMDSDFISDLKAARNHFVEIKTLLPINLLPVLHYFPVG